MNCNWSSSKCIICGSEDEITKEHLIPEHLGGKLTAKFLCRQCNSTLGHRVESDILQDPIIRQILDSRIAHELPELAEKMRSRLEYIGHGEHGEVSGYMKKGMFTVKEQILEDESLISPPEKSIKHLQAIAVREGRGPLLISKNDLNKLPEGEIIEVADGLWIRNCKVDAVQPKLRGKVINPVVPVKIAFEYLALHCGNVIYENSPQLNSIRYQIANIKIQTDEDIRVDRWVAQYDRLFHGLAFEGNNPGAQVQIRLFGSLAFRISFRNLAVHGPRIAYTHDLISENEVRNLIPS
ncbi:MAG: hypothetical protein OXS28_08425 [Gammaproteobacteria bacterium]|nr:hypothetical protein [Gammaproteobacteria bacterium]